jgi:hypothetical protein
MRLRAAIAALACTAACAPVPKPPGSRVVDYDAGSTLSRCAAPASRHEGDPCGCTADCAGDAICLREEVSTYPQGLCAEACLGGDGGCPAGFGCSDTVCLKNCQQPSDCSPLAGCFLGLCTPFCQSDSDCLSGNCDRYHGKCLPPGQGPAGAGVDGPCQQDSDCKSSVCNDGHCLTPCSLANGTCAEDAVCMRIGGSVDLGDCLLPCGPQMPCTSSDRRCTTIPGFAPACMPDSDAGCTGKTASPTAGNPCGCNDDCDNGTVCLNSSALAGGMCIQTCAANSDCTSGDICDTVGDFCFASCAQQSDCSAKRLCTFGECFPHCFSDADCGNGTCDLYTGYCQPSVMADGGVGATCATNADCKSGECNTQAFPDGYCVSYCSVAGGGCPEQAVCVHLAGLPDGVGVCARTCANASDCSQSAATCVNGHCD